MKGLEALNSALNELKDLEQQILKGMSPEDKRLYHEFNTQYAKLINEGNFVGAEDLKKNFKAKLND